MGGIQEECPSYGRPVLVMRDTTERPEGVDAGTLRLVGTNEEVIYKNFKELLEDKAAYDKMAHAWTSQSLRDTSRPLSLSARASSGDAPRHISTGRPDAFLDKKILQRTQKF